MADDIYDVAILGSGLGGATLATILARAGLRVVMLEARSHPRFAIGESLVPEFGALMRVLAEAFQVPELAQLSTFQLLRHHVSGNSGVKRAFSFVMHRDGQEPGREDWFQLETLAPPLGPDSHLYRPDVDAWLTALAVRYGAEHRERVRVGTIDLGEDGVRLHVGDEVLRARFLVDGSGHRSRVAETLGLRPADPGLATDSRAIFSHLVGVRRFADVVPPRRPVPSPPDEGTLHHIFAGGWLWVIPFDNHVAGVNPVCSVGLVLDRSVHPETEEDPGAEFRRHVERFPAVARQLRDARPVRSWVRTERLQYGATRMHGARWFLLPHSAAFLDPLFSNGLVLTLLALGQLARRLIPALREDAFSAERFAPVAESVRASLEHLDRIVHGAYLGFRSQALFDAWYRIWGVGTFYATTGYVRLHLQQGRSLPAELLDELDHAPHRQVLAGDLPRYRRLVSDGYALLRQVQRGELAEDVAVARLHALLARQRWIPPGLHASKRGRRHFSSFTVAPLMSIVLWGKRRAPPEIRAAYFAIGPVFFRELLAAFAREARRSWRQFFYVYRSAHHSRGRH